MTFDELVDALSNATGAAVENSDDAVGFEIGGMELFMMRMMHPDIGEYLVMAADLGEVPPERPEKLYQALLDAGHNFAGAGGGTFARNPDDGHIWLQWREPLGALTVEYALAALKSLGDAALRWRGIIKDCREGSEIPSEQGSHDHGGHGGFGFIRV